MPYIKGHVCLLITLVYDVAFTASRGLSAHLGAELVASLIQLPGIKPASRTLLASLRAPLLTVLLPGPWWVDFPAIARRVELDNVIR